MARIVPEKKRIKKSEIRIRFRRSGLENRGNGIRSKETDKEIGTRPGDPDQVIGIRIPGDWDKNILDIRTRESRTGDWYREIWDQKLGTKR